MKSEGKEKLPFYVNGAEEGQFRGNGFEEKMPDLMLNQIQKLVAGVGFEPTTSGL